MKPVPATVAALTVTDAVPVEDRVRDWVAGEFRPTLPKAMVVAFTLSVGVPVPSCRAMVPVTLPALAVRVAVCAVLTAETVAEKLAVVEPAATVTEAGTVTAELLLARLTTKPPVGAAALSPTVHVSVPAPVIVPLAQLSADSFAVGVGTASCRAMVPVTLPALAVRVAVCAVLTAETVAEKLAVVEPAATVTEAGTVTAELLLARLTTKPPVGAAALSPTVHVSVPAPVIVPLAQLSADSFAVGAGAGAAEDAVACSCRAKVFVTPLALAVNVTVCAVLTEETVALKVALVALFFTSIEAGTATALLLLARLTVDSLLPSASVSVTVQLTFPAPVIEALLQLSPLSVAAAAGRQANRAVRSRPVQKRWKRLTSARPVAWRRFKREGWVHRDASCAANLF